MNKCPKCGQYIPEGGKMCIACGWKPEKDSEDNPYISYLQDVYDKMVNDFPGKTEKTDEYRERSLAAVGYIGPAFLYSVFKAKDSELIRFHANQACTLFVLYLAAGAAGKLPVLGKPVSGLLKAALGVLAFTGAKNAYNGKSEELPYIGTLGVKIF